MKQKLAIVFGLAAIIIGLTYGARSLRAGDGHKVLICHATDNGKTPNGHVIEIDWSAVPAHLAHGDSMDVPQGLKHGDPCDPAPVLK
jgi:hypothetical protein